MVEAGWDWPRSCGDGAMREILLSTGYVFLMFHAQFALSGIMAVSPPREHLQKANAGGTK
jgi:hypothetical protein